MNIITIITIGILSVFFYYILKKQFYYILKKEFEIKYRKQIHSSSALWIKIKDEWHHIYILNDGTVYLNGNLQNSDDVPTFGHWNRELTKSEIKCLYNNGMGLSYSDFNKSENSLKDDLISSYEL